MEKTLHGSFATRRSNAPLPRFRDVEPCLKKHVPHYSKSALDFADYVPGVADAVNRAKQRCENLTTAHHCNPSSGVWALVEQIAPHEMTRSRN